MDAEDTTPCTCEPEYAERELVSPRCPRDDPNGHERDKYFDRFGKRLPPLSAPPSAPHGDGGGVAHRVGTAEGASPMTPEEPCWLESELNSGESLKGQICVLDGDIEAHTGEHESRALRCQDIRPCPACRVRELEADIKENYQLYRVGLRVEKDCIEELEAEVATLREALQIASDMFCGEGWTEAEQGRIAQVRAALGEGPK